MKDKGFTLVELLAVISLLALIFLLVIPKVKDVIETNKIKTNILSIKEVVKTAENDYLNKGYSDTISYDFYGDKLYYIEDIYLSNKIKNAGGKVIINYNNLNYTKATIKIDNYDYVYENGKITYSKNK